MVYVFAAMCALANALTSVFQRMGLEDASTEATLRPGLLIHAFKRGVWLLGLAFMIASFLLQAVALHLGTLSQVQPIMTAELLFLVVFLATWFRFRVTAREWTGCFAAAGGLAGFLLIAQPKGNDSVPTTHAWVVAACVCLGVAALSILLALHGPRWWRAAMFGTAGAVGFAFTASLIKVVGGFVATGSLQLFTHWQTYALALCGVASLFLAQNAYHAGPISASQTALVLVDPLASLALGIGLFGDTLRTGGAFGPLEALALLISFIGAASLAHSSLVVGVRGEDERFAEMLSLRSRSKRLVEAVQEEVPAEVVQRVQANAMDDAR